MIPEKVLSESLRVMVSVSILLSYGAFLENTIKFPSTVFSETSAFAPLKGFDKVTLSPARERVQKSMLCGLKVP